MPILKRNLSYISRIQSITNGLSKELSLCHKLKFSNPYIHGTWCCRLLIFQTKIIWCNRIYSLKYLRSMTLGCRDIGIRKSEFVSKTQFLSLIQERWELYNTLRRRKKQVLKWTSKLKNSKPRTISWVSRVTQSIFEANRLKGSGVMIGQINKHPNRDLYIDVASL